MVHNTEDSIGDNKEFGVASISDITLYFNGGSGGTNTSANDTATEKYTDNYLAAKRWNLRADQTVQVISLNGVTLTDPITIVLNKGHTERYDAPIICKMGIRVATANTNIKVRVT